MRNINDFKFRGYDTELEKMTYFDDDDYLLSYGQILRSKIEWDYNYKERVGYEDATNEIVLMQYAGLTDKKGKEIYEGDIVLLDCYGCEKPLFNGEFKVIYDVKKGMWLLVDLENKDRDFTFEKIRSYYKAEIEVIGNIYDNPDLLEKGAKNECR